MLEKLHAAGLLASGMIGDPDPYTAAVNALELFRVDDVVISTLPDQRSGWMRSNLIERVRTPPRRPSSTSSSTRRPPRRRRRPHSEAARWRQPASLTPPGHGDANTTARRRPTAARASTPPLLGMLLFIISEVMVFGAFFTAYFFIRVAAGRPVAGAGNAPAGASRGRQHRDPRVLLASRCTGRRRRSRTATASG